MKKLWWTKLFAMAGVLVVAHAAYASMIDATVLIDRAANNRTLTVRYSGAAVALVELRVNGVSVATRSVSDRESLGETNFSLDTSALDDGENQVEVRVYDGAGKLVGSEKSTLTVDRLASGPVYLAKPKAGATVQGPVEISLGFKHDLRNVYVSFFVNGEFKALKNYPPYSYLWDTSRVPNGWHEVEAWAVDDTNVTFKSEKLRVFVNNPGGRTDRQTKVVKPEAPAKGAPLDLAVSGNSGAPTTASGNVGIKSVGGSGNAATDVASVTPRVNGGATAGPAFGQVGSASGTKAPTIGAGTVTGPRTVVPTIVPVKPATTQTAVVPPANGAKTTPVVKVVPSVKVAGVATPKGAVSAVKGAGLAATGLSLVNVTYGQRLPNIGNYTILLNNSIVPFDVMPRVVNGVPLTPFRHLFEQAGGKVTWSHDLKTVEADGLGRKVWMKIGDSTAKVNDGSVKLEMAPFIDSGRTVVPLSFIRDSLDVNVQYDPNTGHVLITSAGK